MGMSEGAKLLPNKLREKGWSQAELTRRLTADLGHVAEGLVNRWIRGTREPSGSQVGWMDRELDLPAHLWADRIAPLRVRSRRRVRAAAGG